MNNPTQQQREIEMKTIKLEAQTNGDNFYIDGKRYRALLTANADGTVDAYPLNRNGSMIRTVLPIKVKIVNE